MLLVTLFPSDRKWIKKEYWFSPLVESRSWHFWGIPILDLNQRVALFEKEGLPENKLPLVWLWKITYFYLILIWVRDSQIHYRAAWTTAEDKNILLFPSEIALCKFLLHNLWNTGSSLPNKFHTVSLAYQNEFGNINKNKWKSYALNYHL